LKLEFFASGLHDGPTILLYGGGAEDVGRLRAALRALANGVVRELDVHELPFVESVNNCRLRAVSAMADASVVTIAAPADFM